MFVVVLSTIFLDFAPLTAMMIVAMSLLDDVPIMTIAYDNTPVSAKPIRWHMPRLLSIAAVLGVFSIVETFGLLLIGIRVLSHSHLQEYFGLTSEDQLQTVMFAIPLRVKICPFYRFSVRCCSPKVHCGEHMGSSRSGYDQNENGPARVVQTRRAVSGRAHKRAAGHQKMTGRSIAPTPIPG